MEEKGAEDQLTHSIDHPVWVPKFNGARERKAATPAPPLEPQTCSHEEEKEVSSTRLTIDGRKEHEDEHSPLDKRKREGQLSQN